MKVMKLAMTNVGINFTKLGTWFCLAVYSVCFSGCGPSSYCERVLGELPDEISCVNEARVSVGVDVSYLLLIEGESTDLRPFLVSRLNVKQAVVGVELVTFPGTDRPKWWPEAWSESVERFVRFDVSAEKYVNVWLEPGDPDQAFVESGQW